MYDVFKSVYLLILVSRYLRIYIFYKSGKVESTRVQGAVHLAVHVTPLIRGSSNYYKLRTKARKPPSPRITSF